MIPSRLDESPGTLRKRFQEWGYLYFPQLADAARCDALRADIIGKLAGHVRHGEGDDDVPRLMGQPIVEADAVWDEVYPEIQSLESFHRFFHHDDLREAMERVSNADVFIYPMKMARVSTPGRVGLETPPHQDAHSHRAGTTMAGIWVALHDVDATTGRLKLLARSHTRGVRPVFQSAGVGGVQCEIYEDETCWHVSDVARGDVIIFHSQMVHKAEPNLSTDRVRLSIDTRFCDHGAPVYFLNLDPHHGPRIPGLDWAAIYRNWRQNDLKYYWRDYPAIFR